MWLHGAGGVVVVGSRLNPTQWLVGQKNEIIEVSLLRDGSITLPNIGKVFLSGLSLQEATKIINTKFEIYFIGVDVFVTLLNIRDKERGI